MITPFWYDDNPWKDKLVYLPDLAEVSASLRQDNPGYHYAKWQRYHNLKVDAYILHFHSTPWYDVGIRYGKEPEEYYSYELNKDIGKRLYDKYKGI